MSDYPDELNTRPLTTWVGELTPAVKRQRAPYSAPLRSTLAALRRELRAIGARTPVLEVAIPQDQWRIDGRPYARAQAVHPGIVLSLPHTAAGPLRFACDRFGTWQDNLRAVVLTMEALRAVERHGAVQAREQYRGFLAIEGGTALGGAMSREEAVAVLRAAADAGPDEPIDAIVRRAKGAAHPDRHDGDRTAWDRVETALDVLGLLT